MLNKKKEGNPMKLFTVENINNKKNNNNKNTYNNYDDTIYD